ncbi:MAG: BatA domain-containing protein, partial [Planctomycetota bacterium]
MAFLSPLLLLGTLLIGIPIALHLRRRRDPVRVEFPALRLLKRNRHRTETQLRLRRWVLLALRCLLIAMLAFALARPLLKPPSADGGPNADTGPAGEGVAIAVVIDNGPNAAYQSRNRSRLEEAQDLAGGLLAKLPGDLPVVLADRSPAGASAMIDAAAATARVERLAMSSAAKPLANSVRDAVARLAETPAARREAYLFTDLSAGAWDDEARRVVAAVLGEHPGIALRLVDVGVADPRNAALDDLVLPSESLAVEEPLALTASLHLVGEWRDPLPVQLWIDTKDGPVKRDERLADPTETTAIDFTLTGLP